MLITPLYLEIEGEDFFPMKAEILSFNLSIGFPMVKSKTILHYNFQNRRLIRLNLDELEQPGRLPFVAPVEAEK